MDQKIKSDWVQALRSGEYKQCKGTLHDGDGYCCLGVLLKVAGVEPDHPHTLTLAQEKRFGLAGNPVDSIATRLESMNDGLQGFKQHTFAEIADWIDQNL